MVCISLINTSLQRGDLGGGGPRNRFNGLLERRHNPRCPELFAKQCTAAAETIMFKFDYPAGCVFDHLPFATRYNLDLRKRVLTPWQAQMGTGNMHPEAE
jgi:hypothetical protein